MSNSDLSVDPVLEPATPEPVPVEPTAVEPVPEPEPQPVDEAGQLIPTPEPTPEVYPDATPAEIEASLTPPEPETTEVATEEVTSGSSGQAYSPPPVDFEHTAFNPDDVQHIS